MIRLSIVIAALLASAAHAALADTLVDNVRGQTVGTDGKVETFTAMLFDDAGVIKSVVREGQKKPRKGFQYRVDGKGSVMLPGLIDAHLHVMSVEIGRAHV